MTEIKKLQTFQEELLPIEKALSDLLDKYNIREGVTINVTNGKVWATIDVEQFRKD